MCEFLYGCQDIGLWYVLLHEFSRNVKWTSTQATLATERRQQKLRDWIFRAKALLAQRPGHNHILKFASGEKTKAEKTL